MLSETRYKLRFTRREVVAALKAAYPQNIAVQAIPANKSDNFSEPTMGVENDTLTVVWTRATKPE